MRKTTDLSSLPVGTKSNFGLAGVFESSAAAQPDAMFWHTMPRSAATFLDYAPNRLPVAQTMLFDLAKTLRAKSVTAMYHAASHYTGGYVVLSRDYKCLPLLEREDAPPVFLYQFVEVVEGLIDYEKVIEELPGLSYSQVNGALGFLRRIAQFNTAAVDVDDVEQQHLAQDEGLIAELRHAISQGEPTYVLTEG